ncbi:MAG: ATP-binding protein [Caldilineaceae bacterium]|nr:ATP-binding protein [Caldilineaceae bacterium]HRJ44638.1 NB-ARC domain-containing protein [Caldilineaceae bacterium]
MAPEPQPIIYNQPGWYVENVYQTVNNYLLPPERQPLWVDVPSLTAHFIGRDTIVADLSARLTAGGSVALSAEGKPGVGKTTLAVALAHHREVLAHFSDGVLWAGLGPQPDLPSRLARWANALGLDISDRPTVEARAQAVRDAIGHKRLLLVIDDAWGLEAAETLRCGGPNCAHLLTSRDQRLALQFAGRSERVEELTPADALELLRRLAPKAVAADEQQTTGLLAAVGYLPLAVELLGGYLAAGASGRFADASRSALTELTDPARRLSLATRRLGDGTGQRVTLEETIALSIDGLAEESLAAVNIFYSLGAFAPKPASFDLEAAQAVAECDADVLALLIDRNLLEYNDTDESLALHQTLADVAHTCTLAKAIVRHREHYMELVNADEDDWRAIEIVYPQLQWAWEQIPDMHVMKFNFVDSLSTFQARRGLWDDMLKWLTVSMRFAERNSDTMGQAFVLLGFGTAYRNNCAIRARNGKKCEK